MPTSEPPKGFRWVALTDLARLETGHTPSRKEPAYWNGSIPWIGIRDATGNHGRTISATREYITEEGEAHSSARLLPAGTVCLSRTASVGYVVVMGVPMATSQDFVNWVCGPDLDHRYLKYVLLAEHGSVLRFASGTTHQTIYFPEVKAFHACLPEITEQRAIADVLGSLDDKIESNRRLRSISDDLLRVEVGAAVATGPTEERSLGDLVERVNEQIRPDPADDTLVYIGLEHMPRGHLFLDAWGPATGVTSAKACFCVGDLLFGKLRPYFKKVGVAPVAGVCSTDILVLRPRDPAFLGLALAEAGSDAVIDYASAASTGTRMPRVSWDYLAQWRVKTPTGDGLRALDAATRPIISEAIVLVHQERALAALRDALLPELLSGRLSVKDAEKVAEEVT